MIHTGFALLSVSLKGPDSVVDELAETAHFYISHYWKRKAIIGVRHYKIESSLIEDPLFISASTTGSLDILTDEGSLRTQFQVHTRTHVVPL